MIRLIGNQHFVSTLLGLVLIFGFSAELALSASFIDLGQISSSSSDLNSESTALETNIESSKSVSTSVTDTVYRQTGKLLGIITIHFEVKALNHSDGRLELKSPWYAFLVRSKHIETRTEN
jgi:hypothetical protein